MLIYVSIDLIDLFWQMNMHLPWSMWRCYDMRVLLLVYASFFLICFSNILLYIDLVFVLGLIKNQINFFLLHRGDGEPDHIRPKEKWNSCAKFIICGVTTWKWTNATWYRNISYWNFCFKQKKPLILFFLIVVSENICSEAVPGYLSMGNVVGSFSSGFVQLVNKILGHPLDFIAGKNCV